MHVGRLFLLAALFSWAATLSATDVLMEGVDTERTGWVKDEKIFTLATSNAPDKEQLRKAVEVGVKVRQLEAAGQDVPEALRQAFDQAEEILERQVVARTRELDFLVGSWTVSTADGLVLGTSVVRTDLSDCLIEERFESSKGYQAVSFTYLDRVEQRFYRTYIDSEAERLELSGDFASGALVLSGTDGVPGGRAQGRVTFEPVSTGDVRQTVEISRDGGVTWESGLVLRYTRR